MCGGEISFDLFFAFLHHKSLFFLFGRFSIKESLTLAFINSFLSWFKNKKYVFFAYVRNSVTSPSPPHSLPSCSFSRQALLCHSCYLETWVCKHVSFYLIHCFPFFSLALSLPLSLARPCLLPQWRPVVLRKSFTAAYVLSSPPAVLHCLGNVDERTSPDLQIYTGSPSGGFFLILILWKKQHLSF